MKIVWLRIAPGDMVIAVAGMVCEILCKWAGEGGRKMGWGEVQPDEKESNFQTSIKERMWQRHPQQTCRRKKTVLSVQEPSLKNAYQC